MSETKNLEDSVEGRKAKKKKEEYIYNNQESTYNLIKKAFENGCTKIKIGLRSANTEEIPSKHTILRTAFKDVLKQEDDIYVTRNKSIIVTAKSFLSAIKVQRIKTIGNTPVTTSIFEDTCTTQYIIKGVETDVKVSDIADSLGAQGIYVYKIIRFARKGGEEPTQTILIKELGKIQRKSLKFDYMSYSVNEYIEKPKLCYNCLSLGHFQKTCKGKQRCKKCGGNHDPNECDKNTKCFRCSSLNHDATKFECPIIVREGEILNTARAEDIPLAEVRRRYNVGGSYAEVAKTTHDVSHGKPQNNQQTSTAQEKNQVSELTKSVQELKEMVNKLFTITNQLVSAQQKTDQRIGNIEAPSRNKMEEESINNTISEIINDKIKKPAQDLSSIIEPLSNLLIQLSQNSTTDHLTFSPVRLPDDHLNFEMINEEETIPPNSNQRI